ncbi:MAG: hypothetical protein R3C10_07315 [Pirellulales bacterium]
MARRQILCCAILLAGCLLGHTAVAQGEPLDLTVTFDFLPEAPRPGEPFAVQLGFAEGEYGVNVRSSVLSSVEVIDHRLIVSVVVEPPPPSEIVLPAMFMLNPVVELGPLPAGQYEIEANMVGYTGQSSFVVIPEPSTLALGACAGLAIALSRRRRRRPSSE